MQTFIKSLKAVRQKMSLNSKVDDDKQRTDDGHRMVKIAQKENFVLTLKGTNGKLHSELRLTNYMYM